MSMMRLLSAGRSLMGGRDGGKRLQMVDVRSLPKFGPRVRKHSTSNIQDPEKNQASRPKLETSVKLEASEKAPSSKLQAPEKHQAPNLKEQIRTEKPVGLGLIPRVLSKLKGLFARNAKASARPVPLAIQGELSLDNVKVMRNDLSDTDFEVVTKAAQKAPAQKATVKPVEEAPAAVKPAGEPKKIWNRMTTLIGAGHG
jgi:hypothetical protein